METERRVGKVVGIDLGTTNSVVAFVDDAGLAHAIADGTGNRITPSAVWFPVSDPSKVEVGSLALSQRLIEPNNVATLFKRGMGEPDFLPGGKAFAVHGKTWRPEELSSLVIKKLVAVASAHLGEDVEDVVITVPAYFGEAERAATKLAGELAGLKVHLLTAEPMAAAVAHGLDSQTGPGTVLVFDLGGGTFDVTILKKQPDGGLEAIAHGGDRELGGADFDRLIVDLMATQASREHSVDLWSDPADVAEAFEKAEEIKKSLSSRDQAEAVLVVGRARMRFSLTRAEFEALIRNFVEGSELTVETVLDDAQMEATQIDTVLMVGGSSRIPAFQEMLRGYFRKDPQFSKNLDEDVARGAALMGALFLDQAPPESPLARLPTPKDRSSHAIGVTALDESRQERNFVLLDANAPIPTPTPLPQQRFAVVDNGQDQIALIVNEGDESDLRMVKELGRATGSLGTPKVAGHPIDIRVGLSADGILTVAAFDGVDGNHIADVVVNRHGAMDQQSIQQRADDLDDILVL
ncbi:MAG: Hsp70 family protein [Actinobacteria bacterium]|nr:Hsp70 family protein [Actinomycetota bacterium]